MSDPVTTLPPETPVAPAAPAAPAGDWTTGFSDEVKGYVQNKGFKDTPSVIDSYRNLEKLMGVPQERLLKLPEKDDDPTWGSIYDRLGRPKEAKDYQLEIPAENGDEKFSEAAKGWFHELGLTKKQGETLTKKWNEFASGGVNAQKEAMASMVKEQDTNLRKEWGAAYEKNMDISSSVMNKFGISNEMGAKIGAALPPDLRVQLVKAFAQVGTGLGEDNFVRGNGAPGGSMTPAQAMDKIAALKGDNDFISRYVSGGVKEQAEMVRLLNLAHPEAQ